MQKRQRRSLGLTSPRNSNFERRHTPPPATDAKGPHRVGSLYSSAGHDQTVAVGSQHDDEKIWIPKSILEALEEQNKRLQTELITERAKRETWQPVEIPVAARSSAAVEIQNQEENARIQQQEQNNSQQDEITHLLLVRDELQLKVSKLESQLGIQKDTSDFLQSLNKNLEEEVQKLEALVAQEAGHRRDLEAKLESLDAVHAHLPATSTPDDVDQNQKIQDLMLENKCLRDRLSTAEPLAAEVQSLRSKQKECEELKYKLAAAETRIRCIEYTSEKEQELRSQLLDTEQELASWKGLLSLVGTQDGSPAAVLSYVKHLESHKKTGMKASPGTPESSIHVDDTSVMRMEVLSEELQRIKGVLHRVTKERDDLNSALLQKESSSPGQHSQQDAKAAQQRIQSLQASKAEIERELWSTLDMHHTCCSKLLKKIATDQGIDLEEIASYQKARVEYLERKIFDLEKQVGSGEYNSATTRVLHLKSNPHSDFKEKETRNKILQLESENSALRERISQLDGSQGDASQEQHKPEDYLKFAQLEGQIRSLQQNLKSSQKSQERLQQVLTKQVSMLRDAVRKLFGYSFKMESDPNNKDCRAVITLQPVSEAHSCVLIFSLLLDGSLRLESTVYSEKLQKEISTFVDKFNSIPAFLANLTIENFQKYTNT